ncbi:hypothetical protein XENOCAPTIV_006657, partial [Xenoophorus captivus]
NCFVSVFLKSDIPDLYFCFITRICLLASSTGFCCLICGQPYFVVQFVALAADLFSLGGAKDVPWTPCNAKPHCRQNSAPFRCTSHPKLWVSMLFSFKTFYLFSNDNVVSGLHCKKDAEGWETVQRGRTAKPRSAAMVAKVSPALAHIPAKQDSAKFNRSHLPEKQQLRPECPPDKDVTQTDSGQQVTVKPVPASECPQSKAAVPPTDIITVSIPVCAQTITSSVDLHQMNGLSNLLAFGDTGAEGGASQGMTTSAPGQAEAPMAAVKLESVLDPTELSTVSAERWRSRGRGWLRGQGSPRVLYRLNKVGLKKLSDQICRWDPVALFSVGKAAFIVKNSCD